MGATVCNTLSADPPEQAFQESLAFVSIEETAACNRIKIRTNERFAALCSNRHGMNSQACSIGALAGIQT
jgi:hypothetical protein